MIKKKILIFDKNYALARYIESKISHIYIVERCDKKKFSNISINESYLACILVVYDSTDLFELIKITNVFKHVIVGSSSKEIIDYLDKSEEELSFCDLRDSKMSIFSKLQNLLSLIDEN